MIGKERLIMMQRNRFFWIQLLLVVLFTTSASAAEKELIQQMSAGGVVLMIRHAVAPGIGDPDNFKLDDCATQRNLDEQGREQARAIGEWLRAHGIENVKLYSSQWCRCLETARLMNLGTVTSLPALNSFFQRPEDRQPNLSALRKFIRDNTKMGELIIMVTHQVTISGITKKWTDSGHGKLVRSDPAGSIELIGELDFKGKY
jgi:phosphohistidine phosphatase SixA